MEERTARRGLRWPTPPAVGPFRAGAFSTSYRDERTAAVLGIALGVAFTVCFATGVFSHYLQDNPAWSLWPTGPAGLYRVSQGLHVTTGLGMIPLLLAKLWVVYPKLFEWPPFVSLAHLVERLALLALIGGGLFLAFTGLANINIYRPWSFDFRAGHYWAAWITIGAMIVHIGAQWATTRRALTTSASGRSSFVTPPAPGGLAAGPLGPPGPSGPGGREASEPAFTGGLGRRGFLTAVFATTGAVILFSAGQAVTPLRKLALLVPRRGNVGPQGLAVNRTAASAGVTETAFDPAWRLAVGGPGARRRLMLSLDELRAMPQHDATLPIACVEGWSASADWRGVRVRDLLDRVGAAEGATARVVSFQRGDRLGSSELSAELARHPDTLLALELNGEVLHVEHGYPLRLISPARPGVLQTKWLDTLEVL